MKSPWRELVHNIQEPLIASIGQKNARSCASGVDPLWPTMAPARLRVAGVRRASAPEQQAEDPGARANHGQRRGGPEREHPFEPTLHAAELLHQFDPELRQALLELRVELSPAPAPLGVELCEPLLELRVELGPAPAPLGVELCEPLLEFRVEPGEV